MYFESNRAMQLSSRQAKISKLVLLLAPGKPVATDSILKHLNCSIATLTRILKDVRDSYECEIDYISTIHSYHLVARGLLNAKAIKRIADAVDVFSSHDEIKTSKVILDKEKKKPTSFSLRMGCNKKINLLANKTGITRSEIIEKLVDNYIGNLEKLLKESK